VLARRLKNIIKRSTFGAGPTIDFPQFSKLKIELEELTIPNCLVSSGQTCWQKSWHCKALVVLVPEIGRRWTRRIKVKLGSWVENLGLHLRVQSAIGCQSSARLHFLGKNDSYIFPFENWSNS